MSEALDPLEAELAALRPHDGSARLRQRLADEQARHAQVTSIGARAWQAAALAAAVLLALNLYLAMENQRASLRAAGRELEAVESTAAQMRRSEPALAETEARHQAVLALARAHVTPRPDPVSLRDRILFAKEGAAWDMR
jgi:hypothetical protein